MSHMLSSRTPHRATARLLSGFALPLLGLLLLTSGCMAFQAHHRHTKQAEYFYEETDRYDRAVEKALQALQRAPDHMPAQTVLAQAYPKFRAQYEQRIAERDQQTGGDARARKQRATETAADYSRLSSYTESIRTLGVDLGVALPDYEERAQRARGEMEAAQEAYYAEEYARADSIAQLGGRARFKEAALIFKKIGSFRDASGRYHALRDQATITVAVATYLPSQYANYGASAALPPPSLSSEFFRVVQYAGGAGATGSTGMVIGFDSPATQQDSSSPQDAFTGSLEEVVALGGKLDAQYVLIARVQNITFPEPEVESESKTYEERVVVSEREVDGRVKKNYGTRRARGTEYTRTHRATVRTLVELVEVSEGTVVASATLAGTEEHQDTWIQSSGPEEAFNDSEQRQLRSGPPETPAATDLVRGATGSVALQLLRSSVGTYVSSNLL